jgi:phi LC3 family holin
LFEIVPKIPESEVFDYITIIINILGLLGIVVDPTTKGLSDSERALTYFNNTENN